MKRNSLLFLAILSSFPIFAFQKSSFRLGVEIGSGLSKVHASKVYNGIHKTKIGWDLGLSLQYDFDPKFSIRVNPAYQIKGWKTTPGIIELDSLGTSSGEVTPYINLNYLTMPVLFQYTMGRKIKYRIAAGPYIGYLLGSSARLKGDNIKTFVYEKGLYGIKYWDFGATMKLSILVPFNEKFTSTGEITNNIGFYNILDAKIGDNLFLNNRTINFNLGIQYKF